MSYDFDAVINRRGKDSAKWNWYGEDVLPLWVADMDFRSPEPVIEALKARADDGTFGYMMNDPLLTEILVARMADRYGWQITGEQIMYLPGLVVALNLIARAIGEAGDGVLMPMPIYPPFISAANNAPKVIDGVPMLERREGQVLHYEIDFDALEAAITPRTRLLLFCNPHNPIGRVYTRAELERVADIALRHDLIICSDEIHCDLLLDGVHVPLASLSPEVAARTITLMAPSKTFNVPGLGCGFAVIQNPELFKQIEAAAYGIIAHVSIFGFAGARAAYREGQPWLDSLLPYLKANRDVLVDYVGEHLPGVTVTRPAGTYLAWSDWRGLNLPEKPFEFFMQRAKVAFNDGGAFGEVGQGYLRINFGCPRATLMEALERVKGALAAV